MNKLNIFVKKFFLVGCFVFLNIVSWAYATVDNTAGFEFYKEISIKNPDITYKEFFLDNSIYAVTNSTQSDLLILDETLAQIPYYILNNNTTTQTELKFGMEHGTVKGVSSDVDTSTKPVHTILKIHNVDSLKLKSIEILVEGDFKRSFELFDANPHYVKTLYLSGEISNFASGSQDKSSKKNTIISFDRAPYLPMNTKELIVKIYNNDNQPLNITGIRAQYFIDKVVFKPGIGKHHVYFGNKKTTSPYIYDIANFRDQIEKEPHEEVLLGTLGHISPLPEEPTKVLINNYKKPIINTVVLLSAVVLIILAGRKLKSSSKSNQ